MKKVFPLIFVLFIMFSLSNVSFKEFFAYTKRPYETKEVKTVFISSPARFPDRYALEAGIKSLQDHGLKVVVGDSCIKYLDPREKAAELNAAYENDLYDAIIVSRGGHGSFYLLDYLDWEIISNNPKPLVGYSDITALLLAINYKSDIVSYHGPMVTVELDNDDKSLEEMLEVISGKRTITYDYPSKAIVPGIMFGKLLVGNLSLFRTLLGTDYMGTLKDAILVLEDVGESRESIERMVWNVRHLKGYEDLRGIVFAGFSDIENADYAEIAEIVTGLFKDSEIPVWLGLPVFHGPQSKLTLPVGAWVKMDLEKNYIKILDGPYDIE